MVLLILATLLGGAAPQETRTAAPGSAPPGASIDSLSWLAGTWRGEGYGGPATEVYSAPQAGQISGHFVQEDGKGGVQFYELMQIVPRGRSLVYRLRHFNADLTGWEDAKAGKAVEFPLMAVEGNRNFFDGLTIVREGPDAITVWVRIGKTGGKPEEMPFRYRRAKP